MAAITWSTGQSGERAHRTVATTFMLILWINYLRDVLESRGSCVLSNKGKKIVNREKIFLKIAKYSFSIIKLLMHQATRWLIVMRILQRHFEQIFNLLKLVSNKINSLIFGIWIFLIIYLENCLNSIYIIKCDRFGNTTLIICIIFQNIFGLEISIQPDISWDFFLYWVD